MGTVFGSFFGFPFFTPVEYEPGKYKAILDAKLDMMTMMVLSVALGAVQIFYGIILKGVVLIKNGAPLDALFDSGFLLGLLSSIFLKGFQVMGIVNVPAKIATGLLIFFLVAFALTQGRANKTLFGKVAGGLYGVYNLMGLIGDFVSYTRLVAVSLAGAYMGAAFNDIIMMIPAGLMRIVFGAVIFLIAHSINLGLSLLSAYVHSSRLQYVEFFGKFYEGGGVNFTPFKLKNEYIEIKGV